MCKLSSLSSVTEQILHLNIISSSSPVQSFFLSPSLNEFPTCFCFFTLLHGKYSICPLSSQTHCVKQFVCFLIFVALFEIC